MIAALTVPKRILLFCLAAGTDRQAAGIAHATAQHIAFRWLTVALEAKRKWQLARCDRKWPRAPRGE
jgi:hypothetical protein